MGIGLTDMRKSKMVRNFTEMRGWRYISGPGWWDGDDAIWIRPALAGGWIVLRFTDLLDAGGKEFAETPYEAEIKYVNIAETPMKEIKSALDSCGFKIEGSKIVNPWNGDIIEEFTKLEESIVLIDVMISYGLGAPLFEELGKNAVRVRAAARREGERLAKEKEELNNLLSHRVVNAIGSTAGEFGVGNFQAALNRRTVHIMKQSDLQKCKFAIIMPEHYREDGSCRCDEREHRAMMIRAWGYKEEDFEGIVLRNEEVSE